MINLIIEKWPELFLKIGEHLYISLIALSLGVLVAVPVGVLITKNKTLTKVVMTIASVFQTIPSLSLLAIMIPIFGVGKLPAIIAIFIYSLLPVLRNTVLGMNGVDENILDAAKGMGMTFSQIICRIQIRLAAPVIMAGIRLSAVYVIAWTTLASYVGAGGLGDFIFSGLTLFNVPMIVMGALPVTIIALVIDFILARLEKFVQPKTKSQYKGKSGSKEVELDIQGKKKNTVKKIPLLFLSLFLSISLTACSLPGLEGDTSKGDIVIAGGSTSERQIVSQIQKQMIEHYYPKRKVSIINNLSSSMLLFQAMDGGHANLASVMYTGTSLTGELKMEPTTDTDLALKKVVNGFYKEFGLIWLPTYGFENTYVFMVREDFAKKHKLEKVSDLKKISKDIVAGVDTSWINRKGDGYEAFKEKYGFDFKSILPMDVSLVYSAVNSGKMDVVLGFSTDGRIKAYGLKLLEDDLRLFPPYDASPVVDKKILKEHPEIVDLLLKLDGAIPSEKMQELNNLCDGHKIEANVVAERFLKANNYFESKKISPLQSRAMYKKLLGM